jgi:hypothetical protein
VKIRFHADGPVPSLDMLAALPAALPDGSVVVHDHDDADGARCYVVSGPLATHLRTDPSTATFADRLEVLES